jgi:hypothetical protein
LPPNQVFPTRPDYRRGHVIFSLFVETTGHEHR